MMLPIWATVAVERAIAVLDGSIQISPLGSRKRSITCSVSGTSALIFDETSVANSFKVSRSSPKNSTFNSFPMPSSSDTKKMKAFGNFSEISFNSLMVVSWPLLRPLSFSLIFRLACHFSIFELTSAMDGFLPISEVIELTTLSVSSRSVPVSRSIDASISLLSMGLKYSFLRPENATGVNKMIMVIVPITV